MFDPLIVETGAVSPLGHAPAGVTVAIPATTVLIAATKTASRRFMQHRVPSPYIPMQPIGAVRRPCPRVRQSIPQLPPEAHPRKWRAWLTDASGIVVATSRTTYSPTAAVARVVRAREPFCRMPGCRRSRVDLDHATPFPTGPTEAANLASLRRRHHRLKTHRGWHLTNSSDGGSDYTWVDPNGITHCDQHDPPLPPARSP